MHSFKDISSHKKTEQTASPCLAALLRLLSLLCVIVVFYREDAQRAITKLDGYGYDNLILRVEWAQPRAER